jgi:hypothetical protein
MQQPWATACGTCGGPSPVGEQEQQLCLNQGVHAEPVRWEMAVLEVGHGLVGRMGWSGKVQQLQQ